MTTKTVAFAAEVIPGSEATAIANGFALWLTIVVLLWSRFVHAGAADHAEAYKKCGELFHTSQYMSGVGHRQRRTTDKYGWNETNGAI